MSKEFNEWWDGDLLTEDNPFVENTAAYWAWEGWCAGVKAEREACAKLCDEKVNAEYATGKVDHNEMGWTQSCAIAIRARGEKK